MAKKYILAVDTGSFETAYVMYNKETKQLADRNIISNTELISKFKKYLDTNEIELVILEMSSSYGGAGVGMNVLMNVFTIGFFAHLVSEYKVPVRLMFRKTVKLELCNSLRKVNDTMVNSALREMYWGEPGCKTKKNLNPFYFNEETTKNEARGELENNQWAALAILTAFLQRPQCLEEQIEISKIDQQIINYLKQGYENIDLENIKYKFV